jgi:hypothetical protein
VDCRWSFQLQTRPFQNRSYIFHIISLYVYIPRKPNYAKF